MIACVEDIYCERQCIKNQVSFKIERAEWAVEVGISGGHSFWLAEDAFCEGIDKINIEMVRLYT